MAPLVVPEGSLVLLVGPAGSGKSTFARVHFRPTQVLSSDFFRGLIADDENDQSATPQAFSLLASIAAKRLRRGRLTVIDATNVRRRDRRALLKLAERTGRPAVAILFDTPLEVCLERNRLRPERQVEEDVIRDQWALAPPSPAALLDEGLGAVYLASEFG